MSRSFPGCTDANDVSASIHPRLPVVIEPSDFATWLDPDEAATDAALALLRSPASEVLAFAPIGDAINKAERDGPEVQEVLAEALTEGRVREPARADQPSLF